MEYWSVVKRYPPFTHYSLRAGGQYSNTTTIKVKGEKNGRKIGNIQM
jgi:hypothetical protein